MFNTPRRDTRDTSSGNQVKDPSSSKHVHFVNVVTIKPKDKDIGESDKDEVRVETETRDVIEEVELVMEKS